MAYPVVPTCKKMLKTQIWNWQIHSPKKKKRTITSMKVGEEEFWKTKTQNKCWQMFKF